MKTNQSDKSIKLMKLAIVLGLCLILLGHYLISYALLPEKWGVSGMIISAVCIALGIILSLPTKIYLTILLMEREKKNKQQDKKN